MTDSNCFIFKDNTIYDYRCNITDIIIPSKINEIPVKQIGYRAFSYKKLTSIVIPNSVKVIGEFAFSDNQLSSVEISNYLTTIARDAFSINKLTSISGEFMPNVKIER